MPDDERFQSAIVLRREGKYPEAGTIFHQLWDEKKMSGAASGYVHCLRKAGYAEMAVRVGKQALECYPNDMWIRRELVWACYDAYIKPANKQSNLRILLREAQELIALNPESSPLTWTVLKVIAVAKGQKQWKVVSDWCDRLDPTQIEGTSQSKSKSPREQWYFAKVKSLIELKHWSEARKQALAAVVEYPREVNFHRWAALALAGQGTIEEAIAELEEIIHKVRAEWYVLNDICELYASLDRQEEALRFGCRAALARGEDKAKVKLFVRLGQMALEASASDLDFAARHAALSKAVRIREGWRVPAELSQLEENIRQALKLAGQSWPVDTDDVRVLYRLCQRDWRTYAYAGLPRKTGVIDSMPAGKAHGWIRTDDGSRVFMLQRDLPASARKEDARLSFVLEKSWDHKRNKWSEKAADLQVL